MWLINETLVGNYILIFQRNYAGAMKNYIALVQWQAKFDGSKKSFYGEMHATSYVL